MIGRLLGVSQVINGPVSGLFVNPDSVQYNNLFIHLPLMEFTSNQGTITKFRDTKNFQAGYAFNSFVIAKHPKREFYCPKLPGTGAGNSSVGIGVGSVYNSPSFLYSSGSRNYKIPNKFTVSCWGRLNSFPNTLYTIAGDRIPTYSSPFASWMIRGVNDGKIAVDVTDGLGATPQVISGTGFVTLSKDFLFSFSVNGAKLIGYLNGVAYGSIAFTTPINQATGSLTIGNNPQQLFASETVDGYLWDFRMYNRALSPNEHLNLYNDPYGLYRASRRHTRPAPQGTVLTLAVTDSFTTSQAIATRIESRRTITHTVTCTQSYGRTFVIAVTQSCTMSHNNAFALGHFTHITINQSFAASHNISFKRAIHKTITQSFTTSQLAITDLFSIVQEFIVSQVISFTKIIKIPITQSFNVTDIPFIQSPRAIALNHNFICSQSNTARNATNRQQVTQTITTSDIVFGRNATTHISLTQSFTTSHIVIIRDAVIRLSLTDAMTFTHRVNTQYHKTIIHDINIVDTIIKHRHIFRTFSTTTDISDSYTTFRTINRTLETDVVVQTSFDRQMIYNRSLETNTSIVSGFYPAIEFATGPFYLPAITDGPPEFGSPTEPRSGLSGIDIISKMVKLESGASILLLPQPQLANPLGDAATITNKRSITGEMSSFKKTTGQERFSYTFWLDRAKAFEVRQWVKAYGASLIKITNWRGEVWSGNLITDQPTLQFDSVRIGAAGEKVVITLEFQATRIY